MRHNRSMGRTAERARDDLVALAHRGHDVREFSLGAARILHRAVPFDGVCVLTLDPATLLPTGEILVENGLPPATTARMAEIEIGDEGDFNKFHFLARAERQAAALSESTGGDLDRSLRHRELRRPSGFADELRAALVADSATWGGLTLLREGGTADFRPEDSRLVGALSRVIAEGLRRSILRGAVQAAEPGQPQSTGVLVLEEDNSVAQANPAAEAWLEELARERVADLVAAVASRARSVAAGHTAMDARVRVRTPSGTWLLVHGSVLGDGQTAVILEPACPAELAPLVADSYGLTERERVVTQLVAQGLETTAIAERLHLSPWTVQDHLKSIFEKTGVGTRGALVARLFFEHYAPQLTLTPKRG